ncbi:endonuclease domain-containing 1 protein-like [Osmerus eperlanus]|uniref:endonuclease domain-containing 1 protein-like n=1 Tax=Osmerus eperlanus TaxID=29151 RepID=UPI002E11B4FA
MGPIWRPAWGVALAVLLGVPWASSGLVEDFSHEERCKNSLYMGTAPRGYLAQHSLRKICQRLADKPRFATLYDSRRHMPLYSAYTLKKSDGEKTVDQPWMYEPQLSWSSGSSNMEPFPQMAQVSLRLTDSQAVLADFAEAAQYERGLLNPDLHQSDPLDKASTYTLTNAVPQIREFNSGPWRQHEDHIRQRLNNYCRGTAYVVTGVTTTGNMIRRNNQNRVGIPEYMWTAYCCPDFDHNAPYLERYRLPAFGAYGLNDRVNNAVTELPIKSLEKFLKVRMEVDKNFQIFFDNCGPDEMYA